MRFEITFEDSNTAVPLGNTNTPEELQNLNRKLMVITNKADSTTLKVDIEIINHLKTLKPDDIMLKSFFDTLEITYPNLTEEEKAALLA